MAIVNLAAIYGKIRRLTGSDSMQLPNNANPFDPNSVGLADYVNSFYNYDLPAQFRSLKLKDKLTFNTQAFIDTYPFNSEIYTTIEMPVYCLKREIALFQDPWSFYGANFNWQSQTNFSFGNGTVGPYSGFTTARPVLRSVYNNPNALQVSGNILAVTQANPAQVTSTAHGLTTGQQVLINGVGGMTELNGNTYTVTISTSNPNVFFLNVNSTSFTAYTSGGTWTTLVQTNLGSPNVPGVSQGAPAYPAQRCQNILITANFATGTCNVTDDGNGNLIGDINLGFPAGTIDYLTGQISGLYFNQSIPGGNQIQIQYNGIVPSIPLAVLFFQNSFILRPIPDRGYTIELTAYRQPTQALAQTGANVGTPELSEWWELLAFGAAKKIFEDRLDSDGVALMDKSLQEKYQLAYTRTYAQLSKQRTQTIYADQLTHNYGQGGWGFSSGSP